MYDGVTYGFERGHGLAREELGGVHVRLQNQSFVVEQGVLLLQLSNDLKIRNRMDYITNQQSINRIRGLKHFCRFQAKLSVFLQTLISSFLTYLSGSKANSTLHIIIRPKQKLRLIRLSLYDQYNCSE